MNGHERKISDRELEKWASMSDTEFFFRYLGDADEKELEEFLEMIPEFLEDGGE